MQWFPETGFDPSGWVGYDEAMIMYILGMGSTTYPLPASSWARWTTGYIWSTNYGQAYLQFLYVCACLLPLLD